MDHFGFFVMMDCYQYGFNLPGIQDHLIFHIDHWYFWPAAVDPSDYSWVFFLDSWWWIATLWAVWTPTRQLWLLPPNMVVLSADFHAEPIQTHDIGCFCCFLLACATPSWWGAKDLRPYQSLATTPRPIWQQVDKNFQDRSGLDITPHFRQTRQCRPVEKHLNLVWPQPILCTSYQLSQRFCEIGSVRSQFPRSHLLQLLW